MFVRKIRGLMSNNDMRIKFLFRQIIFLLTILINYTYKSLYMMVLCYPLKMKCIREYSSTISDVYSYLRYYLCQCQDLFK